MPRLQGLWYSTASWGGFVGEGADLGMAPGCRGRICSSFQESCEGEATLWAQEGMVQYHSMLGGEWGACQRLRATSGLGQTRESS